PIHRGSHSSRRRRSRRGRAWTQAATPATGSSTRSISLRGIGDRREGVAGQDGQRHGVGEPFLALQVRRQRGPEQHRHFLEPVGSSGSLRPTMRKPQQDSQRTRAAPQENETAKRSSTGKRNSEAELHRKTKQRSGALQESEAANRGPLSGR